MDIKARQKEKIEKISILYKNKEISKVQHDEAVELAISFRPFYWKRNSKKEIVEIVDVFKSLKK